MNDLNDVQKRILAHLRSSILNLVLIQKTFGESSRLLILSQILQLILDDKKEIWYYTRESRIQETIEIFDTFSLDQYRHRLKFVYPLNMKDLCVHVRNTYGDPIIVIDNLEFQSSNSEKLPCILRTLQVNSGHPSTIILCTGKWRSTYAGSVTTAFLEDKSGINQYIDIHRRGTDDVECIEIHR
ncbi:hypothetical protein ACOME3_006288 [Neoechinorhynchus agilis]